MTGDDDLFNWHGGAARFRGLPVRFDPICVGGRLFRIARVDDAADLLDQPDFADRFLREDVAPYGLELWPSSVMLAERLLTGEEGSRLTAIELGCGLGFVSIACAARGWHMVASDNEPTSLRFAEYNALLNDVAIDSFELLDWRHPPDGRRCERVIAADVLYQLVDHAPLLKCIEAMLAPGGTALIADPNRGVADRFASLAAGAAFQVDVQAASACLPNGRCTEGRIFTLRRDRRG